jgi:redox-sensitive bicupin YhaK (pirin superfamily)
MRQVKEASRSIPTMEGAGVHLRRAFGFERPERYDPFLLFDDFRSEIPAHYLKGFPWHPHRGIETITYMLKGDVEHGDSLGNKGTIRDGEVQWMTAGSGIIHQEMPKGSPAGDLLGFQLWLNLPAAEKMCDPRYRDIRSDQIPVVNTPDGVQTRIISGRYQDATGPVTGISMDPHYFDVTMPPHTSFSLPMDRSYNVITYIIGGSASFAESAERYGNTCLLLFDDGDELTCTSSSEGCRFLLFAGKPLREPIAWRGPIVMNTHEELQRAFAEYQNGTFLRHQHQS